MCVHLCYWDHCSNIAVRPPRRKVYGTDSKVGSYHGFGHRSHMHISTYFFCMEVLTYCPYQSLYTQCIFPQIPNTESQLSLTTQEKS